MARLKKIFKPKATGWKQHSIDYRDANWNKLIGATAEEPPIIFSRPVPSYIPYQDSINCCVWATAACDQEYGSRSEGNNPKLSYRYGYAKTPGDTDGRDYRTSAQFLRDYGIPEESFCPNDITLKPKQFLDINFITQQAVENANKYRIKSYSFLTDLSLNTLKMACYRKPIWIAIPGNNQDWSKDKDEIVSFSGDIKWYHSVLFWDWTENYLGVLNWWGDRYRKLSLNYPIQAALSTEDLPDHWKQQIMDYIILPTGEQFLLYEALRIALNIADEQELVDLKNKGLISEPKLLNELPSDYTIYPLIKKDRLGDLFGFLHK